MPFPCLPARHLAGGLCFLLLITGCATAPQSSRLMAAPSAYSPPVELAGVPFFPQEAYQCGPAALASVLSYAGPAVTPSALAPQIYLPERQGSLQLELTAAARRHGRVPYVLAPELADLLTEVRAGHPVLVLQNLALAWWPRWHYAVVVGYDLEQNALVMRSGRERRHVVSLATFERTWARGGHWALVILPPDRVPDTARELAFLRSASAFEELGDLASATVAYTAAAKRWPASVAARMALGNARYAANDHAGAESAWLAALSLDPDYAPALNNLAELRAEQGHMAEAVALAERAVAADGGRNAVYANTLATLRERGQADVKK